MPNLISSKYVNDLSREHSLYVLTSRAIPHVIDGLKISSRRVLWIAKKGSKFKTATLAGATMPIHPHGDQSIQGAINTLAAPYGNNIPLLKGIGAFGTLLKPTAYGAARYTSVCLSEFTKDVVFRDIEIIPMQENYDGTLEEPKHFLPLIPIVLLNPQEGIAVGFSTNILPRSLEDIIISQITYLSGAKVGIGLPSFTPTNQTVKKILDDGRYLFHGSIEKENSTTVCVTNLPYGLVHKKYIEILEKFIEQGKIQDYTDKSKDYYNIIIKFKRGQIKDLNDEDLIHFLKLEQNVSENMTLIDFDGQQVLKTSYSELVGLFCDWRLKWYVPRYERLANNLENDLQRLRDVLRAINKNVGGIAKKVESRSELKEFLQTIGIIHVDYIADLSVYRFTQDEKRKVEQKIKEGEVKLKEYKDLLESEDKRRNVYIDELKEILVKYKKR